MKRVFVALALASGMMIWVPSLEATIKMINRPVPAVAGAEGFSSKNPIQVCGYLFAMA